MTEFTSPTTKTGLPPPCVPGIAGQVFPATELRLIDDAGQDEAYTTNPETDRSYPGEMLILGPTVFKGTSAPSPLVLVFSLFLPCLALFLSS